MTAYQAFPIYEFKTGINTYLQPWRRPIDAFDPLVNAYVNRGTINKRAGYSQFGNQLADHNPVMGLIRRIDESTGIISLLAASTVHLYSYDPGSNTFNNIVLPANFTGNITNFFNYTNWQASTGASSFTIMANAKDPVTYYDGTNATQPDLWIDNAHTVKITTCLDVVVYKQRLLYIRPTISSSAIAENQTIRWSAQFNPTNVVADVAGNGGSLDAPTGDIIQSVEFLRDVLVVFFTNSTWIFRYTGNEADPFRWDRINNSKSTNSPYGSIAYDERATSIGSSGLIASDGVNVQRYDIPIIDYYETNFSETYYAQAFSQRYENLNQGWTLYVSNSNTFPLVGGVAPGSDNALIYNFVENTWATYTFSIPLTCLGTYYRQTGATWASLAQSWQNTDKTWNSFSSQKGAPILLAGDTTGHVWYMDDESQVTDNGTSIIPDIVSTRWNPFTDIGQKTQFGYIDIYYLVASVNPNSPISVTLNFYVDNSENVATSRTLTLDGPSITIEDQVIATGNGGSTYSGTILTTGSYIEPNSFSISVVYSEGGGNITETFYDDGNGNLNGQFGDTGTINYETTAWTVSFGGGRYVRTGNPFTAWYNYYGASEYNFKRIYINLVGQFIRMEIDPNEDSFMQFVGFILWARRAGRLTQ